MIKIGVRYKKIYDYDLKELEKKARYHLLLFWVYCIISVVIIAAGGLIAKDMVDVVFAVADTPGTTLLLLFGVFGVLNFFLLFFLWFITETNYYKMMQMFTEVMMFLKERTEDGS